MQHAASTLTLHCTLGGSSDTFFHLYLFSPLARTILVRSEFNKPPSLHLQACACMCASVNVRKESFSSLPCADCWVSKTSKSHTVNNEKEKKQDKRWKEGKRQDNESLKQSPKKKMGGSNKKLQKKRTNVGGVWEIRGRLKADGCIKSSVCALQHARWHAQL